ncbi:MAG: hypothetical protein WC712_03570 [Candidatus Brocadiia bacterium]
MNRRTLTSIVLLCLVGLILPESVKPAPIAADEVAFSLRGDDFYFDFAAKLGEYKYERAFAPDEYTIMRVDAYPKNKSTLGDHCYGELFCMKYVAGAHRVDVERLEGYWLIKLDGKLHGAALFSDAGLDAVLERRLELVSLSFQFRVYPLADKVLQIKGLLFLCGSVPDSSPKGISGSNVQLDEQVYDNRLLMFSRQMYSAAYRLYDGADKWRAIVDVIKPVSLDLRYTQGCLPVSPPDKRLVLQILNEIPDSVRYLQLTLIDCWSIRDNILSILGSKKNLKYLSLALHCSEEAGPCEGEIVIDVHNLTALRLSFNHYAIGDSYPFVMLKGNLASLKVLDMEGGKLILDPLDHSGIQAFHADGTVLVHRAVGAPKFHPGKVKFLPAFRSDQKENADSLALFKEILRNAREAMIYWSDFLEDTTETYPSVRVLSQYFPMDVEDCAGFPWGRIRTVFPNMEALVVETGYFEEGTAMIDGSVLPPVRLWTVRNSSRSSIVVANPSRGLVVSEIHIEHYIDKVCTYAMSPEGPLE